MIIEIWTEYFLIFFCKFFFVDQMRPSIEVYARENIPASERISLQQILAQHLPSETIADLQGRIDRIVRK